MNMALNANEHLDLMMEEEGVGQENTRVYFISLTRRD